MYNVIIPNLDKEVNSLYLSKKKPRKLGILKLSYKSIILKEKYSLTYWTYNALIYSTC